MKKVLFVHAYAVNKKSGEETLDPFMEGVIAAARDCHDKYDLIVSLGGWHNHELGKDRLLGDVMIEQLIKFGVPRKKIAMMRDFDFGFKYLPPRSTEEEIVLARTMLGKLGDIEASACIVDLFAAKAVPYYEQLGIKLVGLELAHVPCDPAKNLAVTKAVAKRLSEIIKDPGLKDPVVVKHLDSRTLAPGYKRPDPEVYFNRVQV